MARARISAYSLLGAFALGMMVVAAGALPASADELATVFNQLLRNPDDPALNVRYAELVEARGDLRKALGAYERALARDPDNPDLRRGYRRVKRRLQPAVRQWTWESGATWETNPLQLPGSDTRREDDFTYDTRLLMFDERTVARHRWRTLGEAWAQVQGDIDDLSAATLSFVTGPLFDIGEQSRLHIAPGAAVAWLDGNLLYHDALLKITFETLAGGATQSLTASIVSRETDNKFLGGDGVIVQLAGRLAKYNNLRKGDAFYVLPRFRYSQPGGGTPNRIFSNSLFPGDFVEFGSRVAYFMPIAGDRVYVGAGFGAYHRSYNQNIAFGTTDREDWFLEPTAHLVIARVKDTKFDLRVDYRFEHNDSNDRFEEFENHVVGVRTVRRF